jgi:hypothetical protein
LILSERDERLKAVVAQIVGHHAVLLTENGVFLKVKNQRYRTGQQITFCEKRRLPARMLAMAAGFAVFLLGGTYLALERLPYSYVSIDVNPSMEYTLNWFDRVLSLRAVNEDAKPIAQSLEENGALNQPIAAAVGMTMKELNERRYFADGAENDVVISVASFGLKDVNGLAGTLGESAGSALADWTLYVTSFQTDQGKVREAQKHHTTAGKLVIVENLAQNGDGLEGGAMEEWLEKPVREILNRKSEDAQQPDEKKTENPEPSENSISTEGVLPKETVSQPTKQPGKTKTPRLTDTPGKTDAPKKTGVPRITEEPGMTNAPATEKDRPNTDNGRQPDAAPAQNTAGKPKSTPSTKEEDQSPKANTPYNEAGGGQGKKNESQNDDNEPAQPSKGGGDQKGKP